MAGRHFGAVVRRIERIFAAGSVAGLSEGELLERFATRGDEAAFEAILARHGPMVLGICRQRPPRPERRRGCLPGDVPGPGAQGGLAARSRPAGQLALRGRLAGRAAGASGCRAAARGRGIGDRGRVRPRRRPATAHDHESGAILHEELRHLPEKYRTAVLLCYMEGLTHEEAARQLGWPLGTVKGRLARAREMLRKRLTRRGVNPLGVGGVGRRGAPGRGGGPRRAGPVDNQGRAGGRRGAGPRGRSGYGKRRRIDEGSERRHVPEHAEAGRDGAGCRCAHDRRGRLGISGPGSARRVGQVRQRPRPDPGAPPACRPL